MAGKMLYKDAPGAGAPDSGSTKPDADLSGGSIPPMPNSPPPEGYQWQLQTGPDGRKFWGVVAAVAIGAISSYLQARQANKPRTGYTDQTTTQTPYLSGMIQPDLEAILNYQRSLINQGPAYVGPEATWPQYRTPETRFAPGPVQAPYQYVHQPREDRNPPGYTPPPFSGGGPGNQGGRGGAEPWGDPGEPGNPDAYLKSASAGRRGSRYGELGDLGYLRALFAATGRG
jgi:hypothetical protein